MRATAEKWTSRLQVSGFTAAVLVPICVLVILLWPFRLDVPLSNDFASCWMAGAMVRDGVRSDLYDISLQRTFQIDQRLETATVKEVKNKTELFFPYISPPAMAVLLTPFSLLPISSAWLLWSVLSLLATVVSVALPLRGNPAARRAALLLITFGPVADTIRWGQISCFLLLGESVGLWALVSGRPLLGGVLLGALWFKPQYAVLFALVFLIKRRWRELSGMMISALLVGFLSLALVGPKGIVSYADLLGRVGAFYPPPEYQVNAYAMMNWRALLIDLWPSISSSMGSEVMWSLGAATVLLSLLAWRGEWDSTSPRFPLQVLVLVLATLVSSPHSHSHGAVLLLAPIAMALSRVSEQDSPLHYWKPMMAIGYLLGMVIWWVGGIYWLAVPYSLLAMMLLTIQLRGGLRPRRRALVPNVVVEP